MWYQIVTIIYFYRYKYFYRKLQVCGFVYVSVELSILIWCFLLSLHRRL